MTSKTGAPSCILPFQNISSSLPINGSEKAHNTAFKVFMVATDVAAKARGLISLIIVNEIKNALIKKPKPNIVMLRSSDGMTVQNSAMQMRISAVIVPMYTKGFLRPT